MDSWFSGYRGNLDNHRLNTEKGAFVILRNWQGVWSIQYQDTNDVRWAHLGTAISLAEAKRIVADAVATGQY
jgi:hypothetical protein